MDEVAVYAVAGDGNAVKIHRGHRANPAITFASLCFIDGDSAQQEDHANGIWRLPGQCPESKVFNDVLNNRQNNIAVLTVACQRPTGHQNQVQQTIESVSLTNRDPHLLFAQVGIQVSFTPEAIVRGAFFSVWISEHIGDVDALMAPVLQALTI